MDSKLFFNEEIWNRFQYEYRSTSTFEWRSWEFFILGKDLGIKYRPSSAQDYFNHIYEIVDRNKWLLTKLKYGF